MLGFPPAHAQPHRCLFRSVGIARGNVDVYARVLHLRGIVLQVSVVVHTKNTFVFVVGPLVLGYIPLTRNTTNQSAPFPTPPLNHARPSMHLSWRMHGWLCDLISLPRYSSSERKSCDPPIIGMLFVVFTEEEMKVSLTIRSKPLSASLQLSPHRLKCSHVPLFATYPCRAERADQGEV